MNEATKPKTAANGATEAQFPTTISRVLQGVVLEIPTKFKPGHKLSYEEAIFCSTMHAAAVRSAFEDTARSMKDENRVDEESGKKLGPASDDEVRRAFAAYYENYAWSARGESTPVDPIEAEMRKIARAEITHGLKARGRKIEGKDKWDFAITQYIAKHEARLRKLAKNNLDTAAANVSEDFLTQIGAGQTAS